MDPGGILAGMHLTFLGAAGTVTGSKTWLDTGKTQLLIDAGLFQGRKDLRLRNWSPLPVKLGELDAVILTHAHIDHSGWLPVLVRSGWRGPVYATDGTIELCRILLPDSGRLQEDEAATANRRRSSRHHPAKPLYTEEDADAAVELLQPIAFGDEKRIGRDVSVVMHPAGHIVGSALVEIRANRRVILFTGDVGRPNDPLLIAPEPPQRVDYLVLESTYGNRETENPLVRDQLGEIVRRTVGRGGKLLIPSFAVGRTQLVLYHLERLRQSRSIPDVPVYVDSPMATKAGRVLCGQEDVRLSEGACALVGAVAEYVGDIPDHRRLRARAAPCIIISASGMASGGRVVSHLEDLLPHSQNTVLFVGYQAAGTRGADLVMGADSVKIFGQWVPARAEVAILHGLSAHADASELFAFLSSFAEPPRLTLLNHGEPDALAAQRERIEKQLRWTVRVPAWKETIPLD